MKAIRRLWALAIDVVVGVGTAGLLLAVGLLGLRAGDIVVPPHVIPPAFAVLTVGCVGGLALRNGGSLRRARAGSRVPGSARVNGREFVLRKDVSR